MLSRDEDMDPKTERKSVKSVANKLKSAMRGIWDDASGDVFDIGYDFCNWLTLRLLAEVHLEQRTRRCLGSTGSRRRSELARACATPSILS